MVMPEAQRDRQRLHEDIADRDGRDAADKRLAEIWRVLVGLREMPERGARPKELAALGVLDYRQAVSAPHRIVHHVGAGQVSILLVCDGRRHMQTLLSRRLLLGK
jgi:toxin ParE1/3/4